MPLIVVPSSRSRPTGPPTISTSNNNLSKNFITWLSKSERVRENVRNQVVTAALLFSFCAGQSAHASSYSEGVKAYNKHDYAEAVRLLKMSADGAEGKSAQADMIHYYLALAYQAISQRSLASSEFGWVFSHTANPSLKQYAEKGYQHYAGKPPLDAPPTVATSPQSAVAVSGPPPRGGFLSGNSAEVKVYGGGNMDCGPTCLVTIFKLYNRFPRNFPTNEGEMVDATRVLMTGKSTQDYTTLDQMMTVLKSAGLRTERFDGKDRLDAWLRAGVAVISLGPPYGPGGYGHRLRPSSQNKADIGHYFVVTGLQNGIYSVVNDPLSASSHQLSTAEMTAYINGEGFNGRYKLRNIAVSP